MCVCCLLYPSLPVFHVRLQAASDVGADKSCVSLLNAAVLLSHLKAPLKAAEKSDLYSLDIKGSGGWILHGQGTRPILEGILEPSV